MAEQTSKADRVKLNRELAQMLKGGVIMDVTTPEQARIAEEAGACAVMALERIPADIRAAGGVSRMSDPKMIKGIQEAVSIPVMAKCRIGHIVEAQVLQAIEIDYIDESEVLSPADDVYHIDKTQFDVPFVCGARDLGEALGVGGHLTRLRRTRVGRYRAEDPRTVTAHTEQRTFTTRDGQTVTRSRAVLDASGDALAARALPMVEAASAAMPVLEVSDAQAADLRFGRRIRVAGATPRGGRLAAVVPERHDLVAIVEPCGHGMAKPVTVFPVE